MAKTKKETDFWGNEKEVHYDDSGNKIGETKFRETFWGNKVQDHYDSSGNKTGETRREEGFFSDKAAHYDQNGKKVGYSKDSETFFGDKVQHHYDSRGNKAGTTRYKEGFFGGRYKSHQGEFFKAGSAKANSSSSATSGSHSGDSVSGGDYSHSTSGSSYATGSSSSGIKVAMVIALIIGAIVLFFLDGGNWLKVRSESIKGWINKKSVSSFKNSELVLSMGRIGNIQVGMTVNQASTALGMRLAGEYQQYDCGYVSTDGTNNDLSFMVSKGQIVRIDIHGSSSIENDRGIRIGDTEDKVKRLYQGRLSMDRHEYVEGGHYLTVRDGNLGIVFETDGKRVTSFRSGRFPEVVWIEGCS